MTAQSMTLPAGSQSLAMGGMGVRAQGMDGRKKSSGPGNWLGFSGTTSAEWAFRGAVDTQGNLILTGDRAGALLIAKYSANGERNWSGQIAGADTGGTLGFNSPGEGGVTTDGAGNVYLVTTGNAATTLETFKIDASGKIVWGRSYTAGTAAWAKDIAVGVSGSVYVLARSQGGGFGGNSVLVVKYSPAGVFQWSRNVDLIPAEGLTLDASENVYVLTYIPGGLLKLNSAGTLQWSVQRSGGTAPNQVQKIAVASSGETYVVGSHASGSGACALWAIDASGAARWSRGLGTDSSVWFGVVLSGSSVFCLGATTQAGAGGADILLAEYDTSGALKSQRTIGSAGNDYGYAIADADINSLAIFGSTALGAGSGDVFIGRVPKSGLPGGQVGPYTLAAANLTAQNLTTTFASASPATQPLGSDAASSLSLTSTVLTTAIYPL